MLADAQASKLDMLLYCSETNLKWAPEGHSASQLSTPPPAPAHARRYRLRLGRPPQVAKELLPPG
eukprot:15481675-Alexandrium_andersonii.AAC.1